jgi:hypothetical protein
MYPSPCEPYIPPAKGEAAVSDGTSPELQREQRLRVFIPLGGVLIGGTLLGVAFLVAPDNGAQGFQRGAEVVRTCSTLAVAFVTGAVVSFLVSEFSRAADDRRKRVEVAAQQDKDDAVERRRLVGELREVHHAVKTAQLRIMAHRTVLTYGNEIREVVIPQIARLGGVFSDVTHHCGELIPAGEADAVKTRIKTVRSYLEAVTDEFESNYLTASLLQEADHRWRQTKVAEALERKSKESPAEPLTVADLPETGETDSAVWRYLKSREDNGRYQFPRLLIFLELLELEDAGIPDDDGAIPPTHEVGFSKPIRLAMDGIDWSRRVTVATIAGSETSSRLAAHESRPAR